MPQEFEPGCQRPVVKRKNVEVGALESARKENPQAKPGSRRERLEGMEC
jgi:hypothetical protein